MRRIARHSRYVDLLRNKFIDLNIYIAKNRYFKAIRYGLTFSTPILIIGAFSSLLVNFPLPFYAESMQKLFGTGWADIPAFLLSASFRVLSFFLLLGISYNLADSIEKTSIIGIGRYKSFAAIIVAVACYIIYGAVDFQDIILLRAGPEGIFPSIIIAICSTKVFIELCRIKNLQINFHADSANPVVAKVFETLAPAILTIVIFACIRQFLVFLGIEAKESVVERLKISAMGGSIKDAGLLSSSLYVFLRNICWFIGIHGAQALSAVAEDIYIPADLANIAAAASKEKAPYIFTATYLNVFVSIGGAGSTLCFVFAALMQKRYSQSRKLSQISLIPSLFNISEVVVFGIPLVCNPMFFIPFITAPLFMGLNGYILTSLGLISPVTHQVSWTTPPVIAGYVATGNVSGVVLQLMNIAIGSIIYYPFLVLAEKMSERDFNIGKKALIDHSITRFVVEEHYLVHRNDNIGSAARVLSADLRAALRSKELFLVYQPKIDTNSKKIIGVEALIRWIHIEYGFIPPPTIIMLAEEGGFIQELGEFVIVQSAKQLARWRQKGLNDISVSMNLSVHELNHKMVDKIGESLKKYNIPAEYFEIEIIENMELSFNQQVKDVLDRLISLNVKLAIDDFGMGYSSAVYLTRFAINTLKIDKVISENVAYNEKSAALLQAVISMCKSMGVNIVVEYVETEEQLKFLEKKGCSIFQGYLYSKPLNHTEIYKYITESQKRGAPIMSLLEKPY